VALAGGDDGAGQVVDGVGQLDRCLAEGDPNVSVGDGDLVGGEQADGGRALGVEEQQQAGEPIIGVDCGVVQEFSDGSPAVIIVYRVDRAAPASGGQVGGGELVGVGPSDERGGFVAVAAGGIGQPVFEIGLSEGGQGEVVGVRASRGMPRLRVGGGGCAGLVAGWWGGRCFGCAGV
jgi:hypothetical protein